MDKQCVLINKNCTAKLMEIGKFNRKFADLKNDGKTEFVLIPITQYSEAYIGIATSDLPDRFKSMKIKYELGIETLYGKYNIWETNENTKVVYKSDFEIVCDTLYELYVFAFSLKKMIAFNVLNNMSEIKANPYDDFLTTTMRKPYIFYINNLNIECDGKVTDIPSVDGLEHVLNVIGCALRVKHIITPNMFKFWIGKNQQCNFTPYSDHSRSPMIGKLNKISDYCIMSTQCINYDAYSFISSSDEVLLQSVSCKGEMILINYTLMCDIEDIPIDGPLNVTDMLKYPEFISVYRVESYQLYTLSDCVEALTFAYDLLQTMDIAKKLIGGDESLSNSMIEIRLDGYGLTDGRKTIPTLSYTLTKESIDFGEVTNVVSDFMQRLDRFIDNHLPF